MDKLFLDSIEKLKIILDLYKKQRPLQYLVVCLYLILWLFSSGSLSTTIWVALGIGLGWMIGKSKEQE